MYVRVCIPVTFHLGLINLAHGLGTNQVVQLLSLSLSHHKTSNLELIS